MLVYQRVFKMGSHLARYGVHPTSKLTGSNHTLLLWRHSFDPKMVLGKICTPISYPISQNAMTHTWILRPFRDTYFQFPSFQWRLLLVRSWSNWSRDLSKTIAFCIQWIGLREILNRKPMGFYHQIHGVFRWFFFPKPILWTIYYNIWKLSEVLGIYTWKFRKTIPQMWLKQCHLHHPPEKSPFL